MNYLSPFDPNYISEPWTQADWDDWWVRNKRIAADTAAFSLVAPQLCEVATADPHLSWLQIGEKVVGPIPLNPHQVMNAVRRYCWFTATAYPYRH